MKPNEKKSWTDPNVMKFADYSDEAAKKPRLGGPQCGQSVIRYGPPCGIRSGEECHVRSGPACEPARFGTSCVSRLGAPCGVKIPEEPNTPL
jgi:hypothetical protein